MKREKASMERGYAMRMGKQRSSGMLTGKTERRMDTITALVPESERRT